MPAVYSPPLRPAMSALLFRRVLVATESAPPVEADVLIENGIIRGVETRGFAEHEIPPDTRMIEGGGTKILSPAFFDPHVHLREPGKIAAETIQSGTEAAINGGITGVVAMPNTTPAMDNGPMVKNACDIAARTARIRLRCEMRSGSLRVGVVAAGPWALRVCVPSARRSAGRRGGGGMSMPSRRSTRRTAAVTAAALAADGWSPARRGCMF